MKRQMPDEPRIVDERGELTYYGEAVAEDLFYGRLDDVDEHLALDPEPYPGGCLR